MAELLAKSNSSSSYNNLQQQSASSACTTKIEPVWLSQRWKIENFGSAMKLSRPGNCLRSHVFKNQKFPDACWQLCLYPGGKRDENSGFVSLFLKMSATCPGKEVLQKAEYRFYFLDDGNAPRFSNVNIGEFHAKPPKGGHSWGLRNIPRQKVTNALREDGSLVVLCEVELLPDVSRIRSQEDKPKALASSRMVHVPRSYIDAQGAMLKNRILVDCKVVVKETGDIFHAHKAILAAHSQVFQAMFTHSEVVETSENKLVIEDFSAAAVHSFLGFVYTGTVSVSEDEEEIYEELLGLAEKYGLPDLKASCEDHLAGKVGVNNVCQLLAVADLHGAETLKSACQSLIYVKKNEIFNSEAWDVLKNRCPRLITEVLERFVRQADYGPPIAKKMRYCA